MELKFANKIWLELDYYPINKRLTLCMINISSRHVESHFSSWNVVVALQYVKN